MELSTNYPVVGVPENLQIVTCVDDLSVDSACLIKQLKSSNIPFINAAEGINVQPWVNTKKIGCYYNALLNIDKEYTLLLDGTDVTIVSDLSDIIEKYKEYNVDILYNATAASFPKVNIEKIEHKDFYGKYGNFNAGCCIGKTDKLIDFYKEGLEVLKNMDNNDPFKDSEQYHLRKVFANHLDTVWFDYRCKIFQVMHKINNISFITQNTTNMLYLS
jgi:hypothetical protein